MFEWHALIYYTHFVLDYFSYIQPYHNHILQQQQEEQEEK